MPADLNILCFHFFTSIVVNQLWSTLQYMYIKHTACCHLLLNNNTALYIHS